jgi:ribonucleotide monophosphatase NagD (HAD superfamily)
LTHEYTDKMTRMGYQNPKQDYVFGSAKITGQYMRINHPEIKKVFVIGMKSLRAELESVGIQVVGAEEHLFSPSEPVDMNSFENYVLDPEVGAVVMGHDTSFTMSKLCIASLYINQQKCKFVLTNTDRFTVINGKQFPGTGTLLQGILISLKDKSYEVAGKPSPFTMKLVEK